MRKGSRGLAVAFVILLAVGLAALQPSAAQPGQWRSLNPVFDNLNDVWMATASSGWAVGDNGRAIQWNGTDWKEVLTPPAATAGNLYSVSCASATRCLAVGTAAGDAVLIQWDGTAWVDRSALVPAGTTGLNAIHVRSDGLTFAVGTGNPNIIRIPDANTVPVAVASEATVGAPDTLYSVYVLPPSTPGTIQGFTVGDVAGAGTTWRWDGSAGGWNNFHSPGAVGILRGVHMLSSTSALAVGDGDVRTRWNGVSWTPEGGTVIGGATWRATFMVTASDQWIVGDVAAPNLYASIARWNGVAWTAFAAPNVPITLDLNSVYMLSSSDGWAVGDGGAIIRWNGSSWNSVASPIAAPNDIRGVWLASSSEGWAVGDSGQILRWNGANWNFYQTAPVATQLNQVHGSSSSNVFAVGNDPDGAGGLPPVIVRSTGATWASISPAGVADNVHLYGVFAVNPSLAFAVGDFLAGGSATMLTWDGTLWSSIPSGTPINVALRSVWMLGSTDGWSVGTLGTIVRWNGLAWSTETSPPGVSGVIQLNAVQALTSTNVWAVGNGGTIIHRDGAGWSIVPSPVTDDLNSLYMLSATEGWIVGADDATGSPILLYWDGLGWSRVYPIPTAPRVANDDMWDVWMVGSQDGWAVGEDGLILRFGPIPGVTATSTTVTLTTTSTSETTTTATTTPTSTVVSTTTASTTSTATSTTTTTSTWVPPPPCIIATVTFGSEVSPAVQFLRAFRDRLVLSTRAGSAFMDVFNAWYYSFSPSVAGLIAGNDPLRASVRVLLYPLFGALGVGALTYSLFSGVPEFAVVIAGLVASSLIGLVYLTLPALIGVRWLRKTRKIRISSVAKISLMSLAFALSLLAAGELAGSFLLLSVGGSAVVLICLFAAPAVAALAMLRPNQE